MCDVITLCTWDGAHIPLCSAGKRKHCLRAYGENKGSSFSVSDINIFGRAAEDAVPVGGRVAVLVVLQVVL